MKLALSLLCLLPFVAAIPLAVRDVDIASITGILVSNVRCTDYASSTARKYVRPHSSYRAHVLPKSLVTSARPSTFNRRAQF